MANFHSITKIALILAILVIMLGAFTRLTDAGLGCPDWPGCYGRIILPDTQPGLGAAQKAFPQLPIVAHKAWTEMIHRYLAGTLALLILILSVWSFFRRNVDGQRQVIVPILLIGVIIFQAILGMWTVTLKLLPLVVTAHLLGGMATAALLCWLMMATNPSAKKFSPKFYMMRPWLIVGLLILIVQLFVGAWTSTNYAALACPDFPYCQGSLLTHLQWKTAFNFLSPIGPNYEGGLLAMDARMTIHIVHRYWALITFMYLLPLSLALIIAKEFSRLRSFGYWMLLLLLLQVVLGILNVVEMLPLAIAVAHNGVAVLLLICTVAILQQLYHGLSGESHAVKHLA